MPMCLGGFGARVVGMDRLTTKPDAGEIPVPGRKRKVCSKKMKCDNSWTFGCSKCNKTENSSEKC